MLLLRVFFPWMLLAFLGTHFSLCSASARTEEHAVLRPPLGRFQRSLSKNPSLGRGGKFTLTDGMWCTWRPKDARAAVKLLVKCENPEARVKGGITDMACEYTAKPQRCPGFLPDPRAFWKQVGRALKKLQGKVCTDDKALVKAAMCKRAHRDAHFKLVIESSVVSAQSGGDETPAFTPTSNSLSSSPGPTACPGHEERRRAAEEYCSSSWASVCAFFFSMVQNTC